MKAPDCKRLVLPILDYGGCPGLSLDPHCNGLNGKLENVQKRAARFMTSNYSRETGSMTGIFEELKWEILQLRKGGRIIGSYYCKKICQVKLKFMQMTLSQNRRCRNQHSMAYQIIYASKDAYRKSFSPSTIRD